MPSPSSDRTPADLNDVDIATIAERADGSPSSVEQYLCEALDVAADFAEWYGVAVDTKPAVAFDPLKTGVRFDPRPFRDDPPRLLVGGPREAPIGGHAVLARGRDGPSLLSVLCNGLVRTANQELAAQFFSVYEAVREATADEVLEVVGDAPGDDAFSDGDTTVDHVSSDVDATVTVRGDDAPGPAHSDDREPGSIPPTTALYAEYLGRERPGVIATLERHEAVAAPEAGRTVRLFDPRTRTVAPAVDEAFARAFEFYLEAEAPDPELRAAYLDAWRDHYREAGTLDDAAFDLVARSMFERVERHAGDGAAGAWGTAGDGDVLGDRGAEEAPGAREFDGVTGDRGGGDAVVPPAVRPGLERGLALRRPLLARADLSTLHVE